MPKIESFFSIPPFAGLVNLLRNCLIWEYNLTMNALKSGVLMLGVLASISTGLAQEVNPSRFIFSTFLGDGGSQQKLSIYTSDNGLDFSLLSHTGYGGRTKVLRDPTIMKYSDGKYYVAYTVQSWTTSSKTFGIASSEDLIHWEFLTEVESGISNTHYTWAPEWFVDTDGVHLIVSISSFDDKAGFRAYDFHAISADLTTWSGPNEIGIGPNYIDTVIVKDKDVYHAFAKNETTKYIEHATGPSLTGPWEWVGTDDWAGWGSGKEGISVFKLDDGTWRMFLDCYLKCGFLYASSENLFDWTATEVVPGDLTGVVRHGTVFREEEIAGGK